MKKRMLCLMLAAIMLMSTAVFAEGETDNTAQPEQTAETANESAPLIDVDATPMPIEEGEVMEEELDVSGAFQFGGFSGEQLSVNFDQNAVSLCAEDDETADDGTITQAKRIAIFSRLQNAIINLEPNVDISDLNINYDGVNGSNVTGIQTLVITVLNSVPQSFVCPNGNKYEHVSKDGYDKITKIILKINPDAASMVAAYNAEKEAALNAIFSNGTDGLSKTEIALAVHDYIALHTRYDYNFENVNIYNAYGALVNGIAVCQGYALLYKDLLNTLGVKCYMVGYSSDSLNHAWNLVETEYGWYNVDVTWDDSGISDITGDKDYMGYCLHDYFMKIDNDIKQDHFPDGTPSIYVFDETIYTVSETHPNTAFWSNIIGGMQYYNSAWYYNDTGRWGYPLTDGTTCLYMMGDICSTPYGTTRQGTKVASNAGAFALVNGKLIYAQFNGSYTDKIVRYDIASGTTETLLEIDGSTVVTEFAAGRLNVANKIYGRNTIAYAIISGGVKDTTVYKLMLDAAGDVNLDGSVDIVDLWLVCNHIMKGNVLTGTGLGKADMNGDGVVTVSDAVLICNAIAGVDDNEA